MNIHIALLVYNETDSSPLKCYSDTRWAVSLSVSSIFIYVRDVSIITFFECFRGYVSQYVVSNVITGGYLDWYQGKR